MTIVDQIKERLDIAEVIGSYVKVEKSGANFKARCPFHNEKTPSFFVSTARQTFYCFGCGAKGDVISFVEKFEGLDFKGAVKSLAERAGIDFSQVKFSREGDIESSQKEKLLEIMELATLSYESELEKHKEALQYIKSRGLTDESIKKWRIGFARDEWRGLSDELLSKSTITKELLFDAGLIKKVEASDKYYDTFRGRIMFPISDAAHRVIAFSGRIMKSDPNAPKYLNSPETPLFHKSEVLYGWDFARDAIRKLDYAVLVEGQLDLLLSHQGGVPNTVASSGTALTEAHLKKIKALSNRVIIAYDGDEAGHKAAERAAQIALSLGMEVKVADLPNDEDPASIAQRDPEMWKQILRDSKHVIQFALEKARAQKSGIALVKEVEKKVLPYITFIKSEVEKSHFVRLIADAIHTSEDSIWKEIAKIKLEEPNRSFDPNKEKVEIKNEIRVNPKRILAGIIFSGLSPGLKEETVDRLGEEKTLQILEEFDAEKESLSFEIESYSGPSALETIGKEILDRIELELIQSDLREMTRELDKLKGEDQDEVRTKIKRITERSRELQEKINR